MRDNRNHPGSAQEYWCPVWQKIRARTDIISKQWGVRDNRNHPGSAQEYWFLESPVTPDKGQTASPNNGSERQLEPSRKCARIWFSGIKTTYISRIEVASEYETSLNCWDWETERRRSTIFPSTWPMRSLREALT